MKKNFRGTGTSPIARIFSRACLFVVAVLILVFVCEALMATADAEELATGYVICQPGDFVNIRKGPGRRSEIIGRFDTGEQIALDGKRKNGYLHAVGLSLETDEGWIHEGYVVYDEPEYVNASAVIVSNGRLAARNSVSGKRTRWLKNGASLTVYYYSDEWCATSLGYIKTQYIELEGE